MSSNGSIVSQNSNINYYKCCKNKPFLHYVCIKYHSIYHKCCVPKVKKEVRFIKQNHIICCEELSDNKQEEEISILNKTIDELNDDNILKDKFIKKLKDEHKLFVNEAMNREDEMNTFIQRQENMIKELKDLISNLQNTTDIHKKREMQVRSTQTTKNIKTTSVSTELSMFDLNNIIQQNDDKLRCNKMHLVEQTASENDNIEKKHQILILADDHGKGLNWKLRGKVDTSKYSVISFIKPGALMHQVMENIEILTKDFTLQDFVVIIGGSNDIKNRKTPSFHLICNKLKLCTNTNVIFPSIPVNYKDINTRRHISKYNLVLNKFLCKFNRYTEGKIEYIDFRCRKTTNVTNSSLAESIVYIIFSQIRSSKCLIFINTEDNTKTPVLEKEVIEQPVLNATKSSRNQDFLYHNMSQSII